MSINRNEISKEFTLTALEKTHKQLVDEKRYCLGRQRRKTQKIIFHSLNYKKYELNFKVKGSKERVQRNI